jgi:hypothetical protein
MRVFGESSPYSMDATFVRAGRRLASKPQNPRLMKISFHTSGTGRLQYFTIKQKALITSKIFYDAKN